MKRMLAALGVTCALAFAPAAQSASATPVSHVTYLATEVAGADGPIDCALHAYTFTSGTISFVYRDLALGAHIHLVNVRAADEEGTSYRVVGTETYADPTLLVSKMTFISQGTGFVESVNIVGHLSPNGSFHFFDFGSCAF